MPVIYILHFSIKGVTGGVTLQGVKKGILGYMFDERLFYFSEKEIPRSQHLSDFAGSEPSGTRTPDNLIKSLPANPVFKPFVRVGVTSGVTFH